MADKATRPYNLRSKEDVVEVPMQLHMSDDNRFMPDLLASNRAYTGQVSDSESSINDSDCEALIKSSPSKACSSDYAVSSNKVGSDPTQSDSSISQQVINMQILSQLQSLDKRLPPSSNSFTLPLSTVRFINQSNIFSNSFSHYAPVLWNSFPFQIRNSPSVTSFRKHLKTHLFNSSFPT